MPDWLEQHVPAFLVPLLAPGPLLVLAGLSVVAFVASLVGVPYFLTRLPADYFSQREQISFGIPVGPRARGRVILRILRNLLGCVLLILGLLMLVLPGQGLLSILVALFLIDFPGKRRFERWLIARPPVLRAINALRVRAGRRPLELRTSTAASSQAPASGGSSRLE